MKVVVGSLNKAKVNAVKKMFPEHEVVAVSVPSGVAKQPFSDEETMEGAINRATAALMIGNGDIGIGLEGGVHNHRSSLYLCNWGALVVRGKPPILASGAKIPLPNEIANRLKNGEELGPLMDEYGQKEGVRHHEGAVGILTKGYVNRDDMYAHIIQLLIGQSKYKGHMA